MATKLKPVDIVIVGLGWTGGIMAKELADTGLRIVALERGIQRDTDPDFVSVTKDDEVRYVRRNELMQDVTKETITFRNNTSQTALPMRRLGSFLPGDGVGGAGVHWAGITWRWMEWDHEAYTRTVDRYGKSIMPADMQLQDWGVTYAELEPYYEKFEMLCGTSGKAGNLNGKIVEGGNPFEGPRKSEYPTEPLVRTQANLLFEKAARERGLHPFPQPSSTASQPYTNPDGIYFGQCHYCGFCEQFGCEANAKASPHFTVIPLAKKNPNFELRTRSRVLKINLDSTGKKAVSVTYLDARGNEIEQPADLIILSAYQLSNVHLMLLSGIGQPYDPATGQGVVGRGYTYTNSGGATLYFDENTHMNPFMATGGTSSVCDDFNGDVYDFAELGFIGGHQLSAGHQGARPIGYHPTPKGTPKWGSEWKAAVARSYNHTMGIGGSGAVMAYKQNYLDLDPTYKDAFGRPLLRMTFDYTENEYKMSNHAADVAVEMAKTLNPKSFTRNTKSGPYSIVPYQSTHNMGGALMGTDRSTSALNQYLQSWDVPNVFVLGATSFSHNSGKNPTGPVGALALWAADAVKNRYLKNPGPLAPS